MENFSTNPEVFFKLYKEASEKTRLWCINRLTKRQIIELKLANIFEFQDEIKKAKMINPRAFSASEFNEDDFYNISLDAKTATDKDYIRRVKHITKEKLDEWIKRSSAFDKYGTVQSTTLGYIKYSTAYFLLQTKMLSEEQIKIIMLSDMDYVRKNKSLVKVAKDFGYQLSDEVIALYYIKNTSYGEPDFSDEDGEELQDKVFTNIINQMKEDQNKYYKFIYYLKVLMKYKNNKKEWRDLADVFHNASSYDELFKAAWSDEKMITSVTNHINNRDFDIKFLENLGLNIFPKSQRLLLGV